MKRTLITILCLVFLVLVSLSAMARTTVTIWNWSQEQKDFYNEMIADFEAENPDIDVEWVTYVQDQYRTTLPLALRGDSGPDIFFVLPEDDVWSYVDRGWITPIGDYLNTEFLNQFNGSLFVEGSMYFNGKLYTLPFYDRAKKMNGLMFYNREVFRKAGLDPDKDVPKTFSELRNVTREITAKVKGAYGIVWAGKPAQELHRILNGLLTTACPASSDVRYDYPGFDYRDGKFKAANENHQEVFNLLKGIVDDGSIIPGWSSMDKSTARAMFAQGKAAIYFDGVWMKNIWADMGYPDLDFGVVEVPVPDSGRRAYRSVGVPHGDIVVHSNTEDMEKTMRVYKWLHSPEFQGAFFERFGEYVANQNVSLTNSDQYTKDILEIYENNVVIHPVPTTKNPAAGAVEWPAVHPNIFETMVKCLQTDADFVTEMQKYDELMTKELLRNIKKAQDQGHDVSLDDFIFPDWDPLRDYK